MLQQKTPKRKKPPPRAGEAEEGAEQGRGC